MDHNKPYDRIDRINNQILDILGDILIKHIDLSHLGFVTFTKIDTTRDLRIAKVYYSVLNPTSSKEKINIERRSSTESVASSISMSSESGSNQQKENSNQIELKPKHKSGIIFNLES